MEDHLPIRFRLGVQMSRVWSWFSSLSLLVKIVLILLALVLLIFLSPLWFIVAILALMVIIVGLIVQATRRRRAGLWGVAAVWCFALLVTSCTASGLVYGGDTEEVAEREAAPKRASEPASEEEEAQETTRLVPVEETVERTVERTVEALPPAPSESEEEPEDEEEDSANRAPAAAPVAAEEENESVAAPPAPAEDESAADTGSEMQVQVASVTDGDTIKISEPVEGLTDVRLIGVDTPETYGGEEPYGPEASAFATEQLSGQTITLELDEEIVDPYDRLLAHVYLPDGTMFNETLVEEGYAQIATFPPNVRYEGDFLAAQSAAQAQGLGIWSLPEDQLCQLADRGNGIGGGCEVTPAPVEQPAPVVEETPAIEQPVVKEVPSSEATDGWYPGAPDLDCSDFSSSVTVSPGDPFRLDADGDGIGCDS